MLGPLWTQLALSGRHKWPGKTPSNRPFSWLSPWKVKRKRCVGGTIGFGWLEGGDEAGEGRRGGKVGRDRCGSKVTLRHGCAQMGRVSAKWRLGRGQAGGQSVLVKTIAVMLEEGMLTWIRKAMVGHLGAV